METLTIQKTIPVEINSTDIKDLLGKLNFNERIAVLSEFFDEFNELFVSKNQTKPMTIEQYNEKLEASENDVKTGRVFTYEQAQKRMTEWKLRKN